MKVVGLDISSDSIRAVELWGKPKNPKLVKFGKINMPKGAVEEGVVKNHALVSQALRSLWNQAGIKSKNVLLGVNNQYVLVRFAYFPKAAPDRLDNIIRYQSQEFLPVALNTVELDYMILPQKKNDEENKDKLPVMLVAAGKKMLMDFINPINTAKLNLVDIDVSTMALARLVPSVDLSSAIVMVNLRKEMSNILVLDNGMPGLARLITSEFNEFIEKDQNNLQEDEIKSLIKIFGREVKSSIAYYRNQSSVNIGKVYLAGYFSENKKVREYLEEYIEIPVRAVNPFEGINTENFSENSYIKNAFEFSVSTGLALRGLEGN